MGKSTKVTFCQLHALSGSPSRGCGSVGRGQRKLSARPFSEACLCAGLKACSVSAGFQPGACGGAQNFRVSSEVFSLLAEGFVLCADAAALRKAFRGFAGLHEPDLPYFPIPVRQSRANGTWPRPTAVLVKCPVRPASCLSITTTPQGRHCPLSHFTDAETEAQGGEVTPRSTLQLVSGGLTVETHHP